MYHGSKAPLRTIVIISDSAWRAAFVADLANDSRFKTIGDFSSLAEAYGATEAAPPELLICGKDVSKQPEFPMFDAMLNMVGCRLLSVHDGAGNATVARLLGLSPKAVVPAAPIAIIPPGTPQKLVAIGASTGGIEALSQVLATYPENCPPTVIVQHIKPEYLDGVVGRLDRICPAKVVVGTPQLQLRSGQVVFAPGLPTHMEVQTRSMRCILNEAAPVSGHRPSVDVLFNSVAALKNRVVGVLLTGMGRDGASGLGAMRRAGAWTIAQDAATSTVHGMPRVAAEQGAVCEVLPLPKISKAILAAAIQRPEAQK